MSLSVRSGDPGFIPSGQGGLLWVLVRQSKGRRDTQKRDGSEANPAEGDVKMLSCGQLWRRRGPQYGGCSSASGKARTQAPQGVSGGTFDPGRLTSDF